VPEPLAPRALVCSSMILSTLVGAVLALAGLASLEPGHTNSVLESEFSSCEFGGSRCHSSFLQFDAQPVVASEAKRRHERVGTLPKVYVYELPAEVTLDSGPDAAEKKGRNVVVRDCICEGMDEGSDKEFKCIFGDRMKVNLNISEKERSSFELQDMKQFQLGCIFHTSLQRWPRRVYDPAEADLFFIPSFMNDGYSNINQTFCPDADFLVQRLPYLNTATASRHFWMSPCSGWVGQVCDVFNSQSEDRSPAARLLAKTAKLALEDSSSSGSPDSDEWLHGKSLISTQQGPPRAENLHSIPYPSMLSGLDASSIGSWRKYVKSPVQREFVVSAVWGFHGLASSVSLRANLTLECLLQDVDVEAKCLFINLDRRDLTNTKILLNAYHRSTFCLQPPGDTPSRKGIIDSLTLGCIPVLFTKEQAKLWPWHVGHWEDVAVLLDGSVGNITGYLYDIPKSEVQRLRANMADLMPRLLYSTPGNPVPGDALTTTLEEVWKLTS